MNRTLNESIGAKCPKEYYKEWLFVSVKQREWYIQKAKN
jgi:hypothetical protein